MTGPAPDNGEQHNLGLTSCRGGWADHSTEHAAICSCGWQGPWRLSRSTAQEDGTEHVDSIDGECSK